MSSNNEVKAQAHVKEANKGRKLCVFIDGSHNGDAAFETCLRWKQADDELVLVHCVELPKPFAYGQCL